MKLHFVYGSLMSPEVLKELLGRVPVLVPGTLAGYRRWRVPDQGACEGRKGGREGQVRRGKDGHLSQQHTTEQQSFGILQ